MIEELVSRLAGRFLVFDGPDGAGKSTQRGLLGEKLRGADVEVVLCNDPGGTQIGNRIRSVLLDHDLSTMNVNCETLLFMASRAQLVAEVIRPALASGKTVLCDRFVSSTCAYQGAAGYDPRRVIDLARFAIDDCWPDATVILDVDVDAGFERIGRKAHHAGKNRKRAATKGMMLFDDGHTDAMEARPIEFHRRVREMFLQIPSYYPRPAVVVNAAAQPQEVHLAVLEALSLVAF